MPGLVGRERERQRILALLAGTPRIVSLVGPPGVGKSRLLRSLLDTELPAPPFPVAALCEPFHAQSAAELAGAVAGALGAAQLEGDPRDAAARVGRAIRARGACLLLLDPLDAAAGDAGPLIEAWSEQAPAARFVLASRERLHASGEALLELPPLSVADAAWLFRERALLASAAEIPQTAEAEEQVRALVAALDGIPLAVELAAARLRVLSLPQLLERTSAQLQVLRAAGRGGIGLRESIDASWQLLPDAERRILARCSAFAGGFTLAQAEEVLADPGDELQVLDLIESLRDRSLLQAGAAAAGGTGRFALLRSVAEFAGERLAEDPARGEVEDRHGRCFTRLAADLREGLAGPEPSRALDGLVAERRNLERAWKRACAVGDGPRATELALALGALLRLRGPLSEIPGIHEATLPLPSLPRDRGGNGPRQGTEGQGRGRLDLLRGLAEALALVGDIPRAAESAGRAVSEARASGDPAALSRALTSHVHVTIRSGDTAAAETFAREAMEAADAAGGGGARAGALDAQGLLMLELDRPRDAQAPLAEALSWYERARDVRSACRVRFRQALALAAGGDLDRGVVVMREAGAQFAELDDRPWRALADWYLALFALHVADDAGAEDRCRRALREWESAGDAIGEARARGLLGVVLWLRGDGDAGAEQFDLAARVPEPPGRPRHSIQLLEAMALLAAARGEPGVARERLARAWALAAAAQQPRLLTGPALTAVLVEALCGRPDAASAALEEARQAVEAAAAIDHRLALPLVEAFLLPPGEARERLPAEPAPDHPLPLRIRIAAALLRERLGDPHRTGPALGVVAARESGAAPGSPRASSTRPALTLCVAPDGRWYRLGHDPPVEMQRRHALRLILLALCEARRARPGAGLSLAEVQSAGWPGERLHPEAGAARVYTAIRTLRRMGLEAALITRDDGYLIDPSVALEL
jgi:predicted ATPase